MENFTGYQGAAVPIPPLTIRDTNGDPITTYLGTETLTCRVWPGGNRETTFEAGTAWVSAGEGTVQPTITADEMTDLAPGKYQALVTLTPSAADPVPVAAFTLTVLAAPSTDAAPTTYCAYSDLLRYGRSWLRQLQTGDDEAGFAEQLGRARSWIEDLAHAHNRGVFVLNAFGGGPLRTGARSVWLQEQLDADKLMVTDQVKEAAAKKALAYICEGQIGTGDAAAAYARLARMYHSQADYLATCTTLSLDVDGDGWADYTIDCSCTDPMYG